MLSTQVIAPRELDFGELHQLQVKTCLLAHDRYDVTGWPSSNLCPNSRGLGPNQTLNWVIKYLVVAANLGFKGPIIS